MRMLMVFVAATTLAAAADNPETAVERSHERAKRVLDAAVEAIGGRSAVEGLKAVRLTLGGESVPRFQNANAEPPASRFVFALSSSDEISASTFGLHSKFAAGSLTPWFTSKAMPSVSLVSRTR